MAVVSGYSEDDVDVLVAEFERVIADAISRTAHSAANLLRTDAVTAALEPSDATVASKLWQAEVDGTLVPYLGEVYTGSATQVAVGLADAFPSDELPGIPLVADENSLTYLKSVSNRLTGVGDDLWEDIRVELIEGVERGRSVEQVADRIVYVAGFIQQRATVIARTEVHATAESGSLAQLRFVGYGADEVTKTWEATHDGRTRLTHVAAHGQSVGIDEKFVVGGALLDFPGDPTGPLDEIIQCRCTSLFEVDEVPRLRCDGVLTAAGKHAAPVAHPTATTCVVPLDVAGIDHLTDDEVHYLFNRFAAFKISPAYGGAKIHKVLQELRADLQNVDPVLAAKIDDRQLLAAVDSLYQAKKDTFSQKYDAWVQSPAGQKVVGTLPSTPKHAVAPTKPTPKLAAPDTTTTTTKQALELPPTKRIPGPPIAPPPDPANLKVLKPAGGGQGAVILEDVTTGNRWLFKRSKKFNTTYSKKYTGILDTAIAHIQSKAYQMRPAVYEFEWEGKSGTVQFMFHATDAFLDGKFDPVKLTADDVAVMQREQAFDWMIGNWDTHTGQWIRLENGRLYGVDKGQAFKFFGQDRLDWDYAPVDLLSGTSPTYSALWKAFVNGDDVKLFDPTTGPLGEWLDRLSGISDAEYRKLLAPYAAAREDAGFGSAQKFLDDAVTRKNSLKQDLGKLWTRAVAEREVNLAKKTPPVAKPPSAATPSQAAPSIGDPGDISALSNAVKNDIWSRWLTLGGEKKITPAWGGAKIFKMLQLMKEDASTDAMTDLQILRILDDRGGFAGKPKTYESVVLDWLQTPMSKKTLDQLGIKSVHPSLVPTVKVTLTPTPPTPSPVVPVIKPATKSVTATPPKMKFVQLVPVTAKQTLLNGEQVGPHSLFDDLKHYEPNEVMGYTVLDDGTLLQAYRYGTENKIGINMFTGKGKFKWAHVAIFDDGNQLTITYAGQGNNVWSLKSPNAFGPGMTKVTGKGPGSSVSISQLEDSFNLWDDNDVMAYAEDAVGVAWKLVSNGDGTFDVYKQDMGVESPTWKLGLQSLSDFSDLPELDWKLTGDVLSGESKHSTLLDVDAGDEVNAQVIALSHTGGTKPLAYTYDAIAKIEMRVRYHGGEFVIERRSKTDGNWISAGSANGASSLNVLMSKVGFGLTWRAANPDGSMPDNVKAAAETVSKPKPFGSAKMGDALAVDDIIAAAPEIESLQVIAVGRNRVTGHKVRMYWSSSYDDKKHLIFDTQDPMSGWTFHHIGEIDEIKKMLNMEWTVSDVSHVSTYSTSYKAAKDAVKDAAKVKKKIESTVKNDRKAPKVDDPSDIDWLSQHDQVLIFQSFKGVSSGQLLSSDIEDIVANMWGWATELSTQDPARFGKLTVFRVAAAVDAQLSKQLGKTNIHLFENKIRDYISSPAGQKYIASGAHQTKKVTEEIFTHTVDMPAGVIIPPGQKVQILPGPGAFEPSKPTTDFHPTSAKMMTEMWQRVIAKTRKWTTQEQQALKNWTSGAYYAWNGYLREQLGYDKPSADLRSKILHGQAGMRPLDADILVRRGSNALALPKEYQSRDKRAGLVGKMIQDDGFVATSTSEDFGGFRGDIKWEIEVPRGTMAAWVKSISHNSSENELLLAAGTRLHVISVNTSGYQTTIRARVVT